MVFGTLPGPRHRLRQEEEDEGNLGCNTLCPNSRFVTAQTDTNEFAAAVRVYQFATWCSSVQVNRRHGLARLGGICLSRGIMHEKEIV